MSGAAAFRYKKAVVRLLASAADHSSGDQAPTSLATSQRPTRGNPALLTKDMKTPKPPLHSVHHAPYRGRIGKIRHQGHVGAILGELRRSFDDTLGPGDRTPRNDSARPSVAVEMTPDGNKGSDRSLQCWIPYIAKVMPPLAFTASHPSTDAPPSWGGCFVIGAFRAARLPGPNTAEAKNTEESHDGCDAIHHAPGNAVDVPPRRGMMLAYRRANYHQAYGNPEQRRSLAHHGYTLFPTPRPVAHER